MPRGKEWVEGRYGDPVMEGPAGHSEGLHWILGAKGNHWKLLSRVLIWHKMSFCGVWGAIGRGEEESRNLVRCFPIRPGQSLISGLSGHQNPLQGLIKYSLLTPPPEFLIHRAQACAFLWRLILLVPKHQWFREVGEWKMSKTQSCPQGVLLSCEHYGNSTVLEGQMQVPCRSPGKTSSPVCGRREA